MQPGSPTRLQAACQADSTVCAFRAFMLFQAKMGSCHNMGTGGASSVAGELATDGWLDMASRHTAYQQSAYIWVSFPPLPFCMRTCLRADINAFACACMSTCVGRSIYLCMCARTCIYTHVSACICLHGYIFVCLCINMRIHTCICMHVCTYFYM